MVITAQQQLARQLFKLYQPVKLTNNVNTDSVEKAVEWMLKQYEFYPKF